LRSDEADPWKRAPIPQIGDELDVMVNSHYDDALICLSESGIEIRVPLNEISWFADSVVNVDEMINTKIHILVYNTSIDQHVIDASIRRLSSDPWLEIQKELPKGTLLRAIVLEVKPECVRVELPNRMMGSIPRVALLAAGHELADYENSVVPGQGLDVVVSKVFIGKHRIRLDLARNMPDK
jgi:ribosomal protein S1